MGYTELGRPSFVVFCDGCQAKEPPSERPVIPDGWRHFDVETNDLETRWRLSIDLCPTCQDRPFVTIVAIAIDGLKERVQTH